MTQKQLIEAYLVLTRLSNQTLPIKTAYALHKLRKTITPAWELQVEMERKLLEKYGGSPQNGPQGVYVTFGDPSDPDAIERARKYAEDISEVAKMEDTQIQIVPIHLSLNGDMQVTVSDIEALEGFVVFDDE